MWGRVIIHKNGSAYFFMQHYNFFLLKIIFFLTSLTQTTHTITNFFSFPFFYLLTSFLLRTSLLFT
ncbi:hypothetical protein BDA99DRAFT_498323 [Phascolomyces articulosus]|uniref:Uncharacterized protein n=1 Tax=Phascolomyces articulosus TaxID=60185 RepID=A0AAD5KLI1_9FUNG|nr:hypothetical protein BDA99DRAFT_498323 [Phascolomyces articulosus]